MYQQNMWYAFIMYVQFISMFTASLAVYYGHSTWCYLTVLCVHVFLNWVDYYFYYFDDDDDILLKEQPVGGGEGGGFWAPYRNTDVAKFGSFSSTKHILASVLFCLFLFLCTEMTWQRTFPCFMRKKNLQRMGKKVGEREGGRESERESVCMLNAETARGTRVCVFLRVCVRVNTGWHSCSRPCTLWVCMS